MNALFWWTGLVVWAVWGLGCLGMGALWAYGKMQARRTVPVGVAAHGTQGEARKPAAAPAPAPDGAPMCLAKESHWGYLCTREIGHDGPHVAHNLLNGESCRWADSVAVTHISGATDSEIVDALLGKAK